MTEALDISYDPALVLHQLQSQKIRLDGHSEVRGLPYEQHASACRSEFCGLAEYTCLLGIGRGSCRVTHGHRTATGSAHT